MADVTLEALQLVKNVLTDFQCDITGMSQRANIDSDEIVEECNNQIAKTKAEIKNVEAIIMSLEKRIEYLEVKIEQDTKMCYCLEEKIPQIEGSIRRVQERIVSLKERLQQLKEQLAVAKDKEERSRIQEQIDKVYKQIKECEDELYDLNNQLRETKETLARLKKEIYDMKAEKDKSERDLAFQRSRLNKLINKLERLESTFNTVEYDLFDYKNAVRKFEGNTTEQTRNDTGAVEKCMDLIDQYQSTII